MTLAPTTIVLAVSPSINADGSKAYSTRGQLFEARVDNRRIVKRSTTPFCDAARALLAEGIKPETNLVMRHEGSTHDALRSTVGTAAGLTVRDDGGGKLVFQRWSAYEREKAYAVRSPVREMHLPCTRSLPQKSAPWSRPERTPPIGPLLKPYSGRHQPQRRHREGIRWPLQ